MRISELAHAAKVPLPTVKYYQREGLLPGRAVNARESQYGEEHLSRLRVVRVLVTGLGLTIAQVRHVLDVLDGPQRDPYQAMGEATKNLPLTAPASQTSTPDDDVAMVRALGFTHIIDPQLAGQLGNALRWAAESGVSVTPELLGAYLDATRQIARADFEVIPRTNSRESVSFAVVGTVVMEPVLLALRRLAHEELAQEMEDDEG